SPASLNTRRWRETPGRAIGSNAASSPAVAGPRASVSSSVLRLSSATARRTASMPQTYQGGYVTVKVHTSDARLGQRGCRPTRLGSSRSRPTRSAKSLLEPRVVAYGGEVVVSARVLAEPREQL